MSRTARYVPYSEIPLEAFRGFCPELWSESLFRVGELVNALVDAAAVDVLGALGMSRLELAEWLAAPAPATGGACAPIEAAAERLGVAPARVGCFRWLFEWLGDADRPVGFAELSERPIHETPPLPDALGWALAKDAQVAPNAELIAFVARAYPAFLRGEVDGDRVLFQPGTLALWDAYFANSNPVSRALNRAGADALAAATAGRGALEILEVGGGLGGAAEPVLAGLGNAVARYHFTDLSLGFLRRGAQRLGERFDVALESDRLDIDRPAGEQGFAPESYDAVYGVNVLHLARDLGRTLEDLATLLRPGGALVVVEGVRTRIDRPMAAEFVFQLMPQFRAVAAEPGHRPAGGFPVAGYWESKLARAGFAEVRALPDLGAAVRAYPNYFMGAFAACKP